MSSVVWLKHRFIYFFFFFCIVFVFNSMANMAKIVVPGLLVGVLKIVMKQKGANSENGIASLK